MAIYFAKSTGGFYSREIHGDNIPSDAVEISTEDHAALLEAQSSGKVILAGNDGKPVAVDPPAPTPAQIQANKVAVVQKHMDDAARALNYDDIATACTYADEPAVTKFQTEGLAFRAWRSEVWATCYVILDEVNDGSRAIPTDEELLAELPELALPR